MNKRTRLVVSLLFAVVIILAAAITRFYVSVPKDDGNRIGSEGIDKILASDGSGYSVFSDGKGNCGISESDRIIAAAEWVDLSFIGKDRCIASKKIGGKLRFGCIDYEGDIVVPLIYSDISRKTAGDITFYCAVSAADGNCVIYNEELVPKFRQPWVSCNVKDSDVILTDGRGNFTYTAASGELLFKSAAVNGQISGCSYDLNIYSRVLLSKLTPLMIEEMTENAGKYIEYAFSGDETLLSDMTSGGIRGFELLFPDSPEIISKKIVSVPDIHIYSIKSDDGTPKYEVSVTVETEITYTDEYGNISAFSDDLKAAVDFRGSSESSLKVLSGKFELTQPEYPEPATEAVPEAYYDTDIIYDTGTIYDPDVAMF